jgi:hypothetical protein
VRAQKKKKKNFKIRLFFFLFFRYNVTSTTKNPSFTECNYSRISRPLYFWDLFIIVRRTHFFSLLKTSYLVITGWFMNVHVRWTICVRNFEFYFRRRWRFYFEYFFYRVSISYNLIFFSLIRNLLASFYTNPSNLRLWLVEGSLYWLYIIECP